MIYTARRAIRDVGVTINIFSDGKRGNERARERQREVSPSYTKAPRNALYSTDRPKSSTVVEGRGDEKARCLSPVLIMSRRVNHKPSPPDSRCFVASSRVTLRSTFWLAYYVHYITLYDIDAYYNIYIIIIIYLPCIPYVYTASLGTRGI